jgi:hypothetical protein
LTSLRFVRFPELAGHPNVIVDGSAGADTRLVLSHWPGSSTPDSVRDDLSAQIALRALDHPALLDGIEAVSNNHFDQDGLMGIYALVEPEAARRRRELVIDVARAGDFGWYESRAAARIAMAIAVMSDPARSPFAGALFDGEDVTGALYDACLATLPGLIDDVDGTRDLWEEEDAYLAASEAAIADGTVSLVEHPEIDLAVVHVPDPWVTQVAHRFIEAWTGALHPMAVNGATGLFRVLTLQGGRARLECRYETWVQYVSRRVVPRPDLRVLASALDELEDAAVWRADPPGALTPVLEPREGIETRLAPEQLVAAVAEWLTTAPGAWDPWEPR